MPELGKYATEVLLAYGVSLALLAAIVAMSVIRHRQVKKALEEAEGNRG